MSKINEILSEVLDSELYTDDDIRACTLYSVRAEQVVECMKKYAEDVLTDVENQIVELNKIKTPEDGLWALAAVIDIKSKLK